MSDSEELILFTSESLEESDDEYLPSTQEIKVADTQEASNASDFFEKLRDSQLLPQNEESISQSNEIQIKIEESDGFSIDSFNESKRFAEKKKRGRKRKIRTPEEMVIHLKEKKEKNRLAAQRLRQKKCSESQKYDKEVTELEANVRAKRQFAELIENNVNQLRNRIKLLFGNKKIESITIDGSQQTIKVESIGNVSGLKDIKTIIGHNFDKNKNFNQLMKTESDSKKYIICISR